jgi:hypothetical protein
MKIARSDRHSPNAPGPIVDIVEPASKITVWRDVHAKKQERQITVTELGMQTREISEDA